MAYIDGKEVLFSPKITMVSGTDVTVGGERVATFDADTKVDKEVYNQFKEDIYGTLQENVDDLATPIANHEKRIENLENILLAYTEDTAKAYEKVVPEGVGKTALIDYIGGASYECKNLYNPNGSQFSVNEDGSIHISGIAANYMGATTAELPSVTLNAGTYYLYFTMNVSADCIYFVDGMPFGANIIHTIELSERTTINPSVDFDGTGSESGKAIADIWIMLSKTSTNVFEPYFEGTRHSPITDIKSEDADGNLIDTYTIPDEIKSLEGYGEEGFTHELDAEIMVHGGGKLIFENQYKYAVPSSVTYVTAKE